MPRKKFNMESDGTSRIVSINDSVQNKTSFGERLKMLRIRAGISTKELAEGLGLAYGSVYNWESGRTRPDIANIPAICKVLHISISELFLDLPEIADITPEDQEHIRVLHELSRAHMQYIMKMTRELRDVEISAGMVQTIREDIVRLTYVTETLAAGVGFSDNSFGPASKSCYLYADSYTTRADYVYRVSGESMEPDFHDGDMVLVQKAEKTQVHPGDICACIADGALYIKEYQRDGLHSLNPDYPVMTPQTYSDIRIIGRVLATVEKSDIPTSLEIQRFVEKTNG